MKGLTACGDRLRQAHGLPALLDAACDAFEVILTVIGTYEDATSTGMAITFLLVATRAANARDAVLFAPSLPPRALHPRQAGQQPERGSAPDIRAAVADLSQLLASQLARTATTLAAGPDKAACHDAGRYARQIHDLLARSAP